MSTIRDTLGAMNWARELQGKPPLDRLPDEREPVDVAPACSRCFGGPCDPLCPTTWTAPRPDLETARRTQPHYPMEAH